MAKTLEGGPISEKMKSDLYSAVVFTKISKDYLELMLADRLQIKREARGLLKDHATACSNFIVRVRAQLTTEEGKKQFDAEWQKDYLAYASIFDSLMRMTPEQWEGVEYFCLGLLSGEIKMEPLKWQYRDGARWIDIIDIDLFKQTYPHAEVREKP